jgi:PX-associated
MCASSHSWIRLKRRSSGKINCRLCVATPPLKPWRSLLTTFDPQFLESFAKKHISSSEDRLEETKRKKLSIKCQKLVELMMVSGIPTASGYEERIRFSELEVVDAGAIDHGVLSTLPEGHYMNGWDVNVAGVRTTLVKRNIRYHKHAVSHATV